MKQRVKKEETGREKRQKKASKVKQEVRYGSTNKTQGQNKRKEQKEGRKNGQHELEVRYEEIKGIKEES